MAESRNKSFCSVPQCSNSKQKQPYLSFHDFPSNENQRKNWVCAIRREEGSMFVIRRGSTFVCSQHFTADDYIQGSSRLKVGAVPSRFQWNNLYVAPQKQSAFERSSARLGIDVRARTTIDLKHVSTSLETSVKYHDYAAQSPAGEPSAEPLHPDYIPPLGLLSNRPISSDGSQKLGRYWRKRKSVVAEPMEGLSEAIEPANAKEPCTAPVATDLSTENIDVKMYRRGGGRNCAVFGCTNSQRKLSIWRRETCELHSPLLHNACPCLEPFCFYNFPRDKMKQQAWSEAIGRKPDFSPSKASVVCSTHFLDGSPTSEHPVPVLNLRKGDKPVTDDGASEGSGRTNLKKKTLPNPKRKRVYKAMLEETAVEGISEGSAELEKNKLDIEGRYPQGSWEQGTVEAIMNLRTFNTTATTSQIAQTIIANLKDENDFLRAQNIKLRWELQSLREKHDAELRAASEELLALRRSCSNEPANTTTRDQCPVLSEVQTGTDTVANSVETPDLQSSPLPDGGLSSRGAETGMPLVLDRADPT